MSSPYSDPGTRTVTFRIPGCGCVVYILAIIGFLYLVGCVG